MSAPLATAPPDNAFLLAVERTRLAHERTLMAWVRTAASLVSFGFTIYKFFEFDVRDRAPGPEPLLGPRGFALAMIVIGLVSLLLATIQHRQSMRLMRTEYGDMPHSTAAVVAGMFSVPGLFALIVVLLRQ